MASFTLSSITLIGLKFYEDPLETLLYIGLKFQDNLSLERSCENINSQTKNNI